MSEDRTITISIQEYAKLNRALQLVRTLSQVVDPLGGFIKDRDIVEQFTPIHRAACSFGRDDE